jgi:hypothetical protein
MHIARTFFPFAASVSLALFGCALPHAKHRYPEVAEAASETRSSKSSADGVETLIRVDHEGNVYRRSDEPRAASAASLTKEKDAAQQASPTSARRNTLRQPPEADAANTTASKNYGDLASAIDEPQVDAARVAELVAAHARTSTPIENIEDENNASQQVAASTTATINPPDDGKPTSVQPASHTVPQSVGEPVEPKIVTLPAGVFPTVVRSTRFELEYDDKVLGDAGIAKVELYGTRDAGRTWHKLGEDDDHRSPYTVEMPEEGVFGFRIAVAGKNGLASRAPKSGELPELWVRVDLSEPMFRANLRPAGETVAKDQASSASASPSDNPVAAPAEKPTIQHSSTVAQVSLTEEIAPSSLESADWKAHLTQAIAAAELQLNNDRAAGNSAPLTDEQRQQLSAHLRMLYLAAGRHEDAIKSTSQDDKLQNEFWSHQMHGLKLLVEPTQAPVGRQASAALAELHEAVDKLAAISELQVKNLSFCTAANSFGVYETTIEGTTWKHNDYSKRKFEPEQPIVLYFEIANFASEQTASREFPDGAWRTSLRGSYTIVDSSGSPVEQRELKLKDDLSRNRRHDYYVAYKSWIPKLNPGQYSLELLVEDSIAGKIGTSSIDFEVVAR